MAQDLPDNPNDIPGPVHPAPEWTAEGQFEALVEPSAGSPGCKYLGGQYDEGDVICHKGGEWRCEGAIWIDQGKPC